MKILIFCLAVLMLFHNSTKNIKCFSVNDTTDILNIIFKSKQIVNSVVRTNVDSLYIMRNKYYNKTWPAKLNKYTIYYIDDSKYEREANPLNIKSLNQKWRLIVPIFKIKNDSVEVEIFNFNFQSAINFKMRRKGKTWVIYKINKAMD